MTAVDRCLRPITDLNSTYTQSEMPNQAPVAAVSCHGVGGDGQRKRVNATEMQRSPSRHPA